MIEFSYLKEINQSIKCNGCRQSAYDQLIALNHNELNTGLRMYYYYLIGKYWELRFKQEQIIEFLEKANQNYDQISLEAENGGVVYRNPKYIFKRAWVKYLLSQHATVEEEKHALTDKARELVNYGLKEHPTSSSFCFLKTKLPRY